MTEASDLSIHTLQRLYSEQRTTPAEVVTRIYDRLEAEPLSPVWIHLVPRSHALLLANEIGRSARGPLYGVPFAVKDNFDVAGLPTTAGCPDFSYVAQQTAPVVERLLAAGAILIGKTNMDQFATGLVGTRTPYGACTSVFHPEFISGGSSSGSAVAVASGLVSFALGTDTAGSGRVPAAFNNIVGLKPTRGALSTRGVVPACRSLDCVSIFTLAVDDADTVFRQARDFDPQDPYSREWTATAPTFSRRLRIGIPGRDQLNFFGDSEYASLYGETVAALSALGAEVVESDLRPFREAAELLYSGPYVAERFAAVGEWIQDHQQACDPTVAAIILGAQKYTAADAFRALYKLQGLRRETDRCWNEVDFLVLPTAPTIYRLDEVQAEPIRLNAALGTYTNFVNLLDLSAVAVPAGFRRDGLPFGVSLIGPACSEQILLEWGAAVQHARTLYAGKQVLQRSGVSGDMVKIAVVGAHLSGMPLNAQLTARGGKLWKTTRTAPPYRLYALPRTAPPKPGLIRDTAFSGGGIEVEVWLLPTAEFGSFVEAVPRPLAIGSCELADGEVVKGFVCEQYAVADAVDITHLGGWRKYMSTQS